MASGIHAVSPHKNMNLISETLVYGSLSKYEFSLPNFVDFQENKEYSRFSQKSELYGYINNLKDDSKFPLKAIVNCNNNVADLGQQKCIKSTCGTDSSQDHETDESTASSQSGETSDSTGNRSKNSTQERKIINEKTEGYHRPCFNQPNLYQPNVSLHKNSKYYVRTGQRTKFSKQSEETERRVHGLMKRFQSRAYKMKINPNPQVLLNGSPWDPLNRAMWDVFLARIQKEETYINKLKFWKSVFIFFKMCLSNYGLYLVGSTMTGFALEGSDIDICLLTRPFSNEPRLDAVHNLNYLQHALLQNGLASEAEVIMAKVPILKFKNHESGFHVDLNCNNLVGIQNTRLLYCYAQLDWRVRPLVVIVKTWARCNNINDAKNMTVSSYSWTLMVIHYLQCGVFPAILPCLQDLYPEEFISQEGRAIDVQGEIEGLKEFQSENTRCLGDLLIGFFHYYSYFNYQHYAISVRTGSRIPIKICQQAKSPKNDPHQWKFLCIEEPFDLSNTAKSVFDLEIFKHIKQVIAASYKELACNKALSQILPLMHLNGQR